jgi:hypothetical protein
MSYGRHFLKYHLARARTAGMVVMAAVMVLAPGASASHGPPLGQQDFTVAAAQGFGDRQNSWAWAMQWWGNHLYVGTNRAARCIGVWFEMKNDQPITYPPTDPGIACTPDPSDLPLQAEIWRWSPTTNTWERVYQSPNDVPNPDHAGKLVSRDVGYRTAAAFTESDGTEALYVGALNSQFMWDGKVPSPRILRSTDGVTFTPIPQLSGTFMGSLTLPSFRSMAAYNDKLFAVNGGFLGPGVLIVSAKPGAGNNAWFRASPLGMRIFEVQPFNGWLYVGALDAVTGYSILKTQATGIPPYTFTPVVTGGGHLAVSPSRNVVSMHVFDGRLYVGTDNPAELIRINPDDTWELVAGTPRQAPNGSWIYPLTGLDEGFNNGFNDHIWRMQAHDGRLYAGSYDSSYLWRKYPGLDLALKELFGFDLFQTADGHYVTPVTTKGMGDQYNFGVRNMASTPHGLFVGTTNDHFGLNVLRGVQGPAPVLAAPGRLEAEVSGSRTVLSWEPVPGATRYRVMRAPLRYVTSLEPVGTRTWFARYYTLVGTTTRPMFEDSAPGADEPVLYLVTAENADGGSSGVSNLVRAPSLNPAITFAGLLSTIDRLHQRGRFVSSQSLDSTRQAITAARDAAQAGELSSAVSTLQTLRQDTLNGTVALMPDSTDLEVLLAKLTRRIQLNHHRLVERGSLF